MLCSIILLGIVHLRFYLLHIIMGLFNYTSFPLIVSYLLQLLNQKRNNRTDSCMEPSQNPLTLKFVIAKYYVLKKVKSSPGDSFSWVSQEYSPSYNVVLGYIYIQTYNFIIYMFITFDVIENIIKMISWNITGENNCCQFVFTYYINKIK